MYNLLWALAAVLIIFWVLGFSLHFTLGGLIHLCLVLALAAIVVRLVLGRRTA